MSVEPDSGPPGTSPFAGVRTILVPPDIVAVEQRPKAPREKLLDELSQQYGLGYQSTNSARDDTWRQIKVEVDGQRRVRARQGYRAPASSSQRTER